MLESNSCLWDIYHPDYLKRDMKKIGYGEIATELLTTNASKKQIGDDKRKDNKERSKYLQIYKSNWIFFYTSYQCWQK